MSRRLRRRPDPPMPRGGASSRPGRCPECGGDESLLEVFLMAGGQNVSFAICSRCEWRRWGQEGETVPRTRVLSVVASEALAEAAERAARRPIRAAPADGTGPCGATEEGSPEPCGSPAWELPSPPRT